MEKTKKEGFPSWSGLDTTVQATHHSGGSSDATQWDEEQGHDGSQASFRACPQGLALMMAFVDQQGEGR